MFQAPNVNVVFQVCLFSSCTASPARLPKTFLRLSYLVLSSSATAVNFHSQCDLCCPVPWLDSQVHCSDWGLKLVCYYSVPVDVSRKFLKQIVKEISWKKLCISAINILNYKGLGVRPSELVKSGFTWVSVFPCVKGVEGGSSLPTHSIYSSAQSAVKDKYLWPISSSGHLASG